MFRSRFIFRIEQFRGITDEGLSDWMRYRDSKDKRDTYNDNFNRDEQDNDELHASARCLHKSARALAHRPEEKSHLM